MSKLTSPLAQTTLEDAPKDLRVRRTQRLLAEALVELALERPFEAITVRDLTDRAEIGYATFFRHYKDLEALLRDMLDELLNELLTLLRPLAHDPLGAGTLVFRHVAAHSDLYRVLLRTSRAVDLLPEAVRVGTEGVRKDYVARPGSRVPLELAAHHVIHAFVNLIEWWLEQDLPYGPERMGEIYCDLVWQPTEAAALRPRRRSSEDGG